jgi:4-diphosphocytidyl-2-C-methyl-D-erythritol kinase
VIALRTHAPGKVNLCLLLGAARADGLHELVSVVQAVSLADEVTLTAAEGERDEVVCPGVAGENLAARALAAYRAASGWDGPPVRVTVDKRVPIAAGMGGGSSDAAAVLRLAARARAAERAGSATGGSTSDASLELAFSLGADVPALLEPGLALVRGAGERVRRLDGPGVEGELLVVPSPHALSTADVFGEADRLGLPRAAAELEGRAAEVEAALARGLLPPELAVNDLEPATRSLCPPAGAVLDALREAGARIAAVSGSGPTAFGVFAARPPVLPPALAGARWVTPVGAEAGAVEELAA